ncbi:hypothetical protein [Massilia yuzhufengensis]|uniref:Uncharacterized protein n=1 Tax=Massilia yuzhufengensis TaxID=1164594 RepID=A0A1I1LDY5_9BURK|nr:hypothetical protein [Massilia yuzhufengensis]SFC71195.1 hypothetical protein SAMN05216204_10957 [Massilia yuzhufengensis]
MKIPAVFLLAASLGAAAFAAEPVNHVYTPADGVHETRMFHACHDDEDVQKRQKINLVMGALASTDVEAVARKVESGKPSTELILFRVKGRDASIKTLFRSNDGPHCQQGVHSLQFTDRTVHSPNQLGVKR